MAITVPTVGSEISVTAFGKPVADALNNRVLAQLFSSTTQGQTAAGGYTDIPGATVTFTAVANTRYRVTYGSNVNGATAQGFIAVALRRVSDNRIIGQEVIVLSTVPSYGHAVSGVAFMTKANNNSQAAGSMGLKLSVSSTGSTWGVDGAASPTFIVVEDIGADP